MKKKNGFISTSIIFAFFVTFIAILIVIMTTYTNNRTRQNVVKNDIKAKMTLENAMSLAAYIESLNGTNSTDSNGNPWGVTEDFVTLNTKNYVSMQASEFATTSAGSGSNRFTCSGTTCTSNNKGVNSSTAEIEFSVPVSGNYKFCYTISSESRYDKGYFLVDDVAIINGVSNVGSSCLDVDLSSASTLKARYVKDKSGNQNDDTFKFYLEKPDTTKTTSQSAGIRYIGQNPNNYISFNGELWRIIGVFDDNSHGVIGEKLVKIIRDSSIGAMPVDYKQTGVGSSAATNGSNDWSDSQLMMMLNPLKYLNAGRDMTHSLTHTYTTTAISNNLSSSNYVNSTAGSGTEKFTCSGTTCTSNNAGQHSSTAEITFKVPSAGRYEVCYTASSESNYDKGYFYVDNSKKVNGVSGTSSACVDLGTLTTSNVLKAQYTKDSSDSANDDNFKFYINQTSGINVMDQNNRTIFKNMGSYFDESYTAYKPASVTTSGGLELQTLNLTRLSAEAQEMIETVKWGTSTTNYNMFSENTTGSPEDWYNYERNNSASGLSYTARPYYWFGKVGLMYPSDFGYATTGHGSTYTREKCTKNLALYNNNSNCSNYSWLQYGNSTSNTSPGTKLAQWTMTAMQNKQSFMYIDDDGSFAGTAAKNNKEVRPVVYLKAAVEKIGGSGTYNDPMQIELNTEKKPSIFNTLITNANGNELVYDHGYRFVGERPNNYVYVGQSNSNLFYRVIGIVDEEYDSDGNGTIDTSGPVVKMILQGTKSSVKWNDTKENTYVGSKVQDYILNTYLTNSTVQKYINKFLTVKWHLGSISSSYAIASSPATYYYMERNNAGSPSNPTLTSLVANVGLINPSDYLFSNDGGKDGSGNKINRNACLSGNLSSWTCDTTGGTYEGGDSLYCTNNTWMYYNSSSLNCTNNSSSYTYWTMNPYPDDASRAYVVYYSGGVIQTNSATSSARIRPSIYLGPEEVVSGGNGTYDSPYMVL